MTKKESVLPSGLHKAHLYTVVSFNPTTNIVELANPYGVGHTSIEFTLLVTLGINNWFVL